VQPHLWIDGGLRRGKVDPPAQAGPACYTTGRYVGGGILHGAQVAARLARDARALQLGLVDRAAVLRALVELGTACFGASGEGVVRMQASPGLPRARLLGTARPLGPEPEVWRAICTDLLHPGPGEAPGVKREGCDVLARARAAAERAEVQEALLFDAEGILVEGSRTNLLVVGAEDEIATPPRARGPVTGVGLQVLRSRLPGIADARLDRPALGKARELIAINAVRGPRPIVRVDGRPVGDGRPGPVHRRLAAVWWPR